jgi:hypothetical protein
MKRLAVVLGALALSMAMGFPVRGYENPQKTQDEKKPELMDIKGTVRSDNAKITFVADEGGKTWDVINPETLKDHVGQHVQLNAQVYADKGQIHVMTVVQL